MWQDNKSFTIQWSENVRLDDRFFFFGKESGQLKHGVFKMIFQNEDKEPFSYFQSGFSAKLNNLRLDKMHFNVLPTSALFWNYSTRKSH